MLYKMLGLLQVCSFIVLFLFGPGSNIFNFVEIGECLDIYLNYYYYFFISVVRREPFDVTVWFARKKEISNY